MEKIQVNKIRGKYETSEKGFTSAGDDTTPSLRVIASKVNELIDERTHEQDSVNYWRETVAKALDLHHSASWGSVFAEIGRLKALVSIGFVKTEGGRVILNDTDRHTISD